MELIRSRGDDLYRLADFYRYAIANTKDMAIHARWVYGLHPSDDIIRAYIGEGAMYHAERDGRIIAAAALTPCQGTEYHDAAWGSHLSDDEVAVIHILCVDPAVRRQGVASETVRALIAMAKAAGKRAVRLDAVGTNTPAQSLYDSLGFERRGVCTWFAVNTGMTEFRMFEMLLGQ